MEWNEDPRKITKKKKKRNDFQKQKKTKNQKFKQERDMFTISVSI